MCKYYILFFVQQYEVDVFRLNFSPVLGNRRVGVPAEGGNLLAVGGNLLAAVRGWGRGRTRWGRSAVVVVLVGSSSRVREANEVFINGFDKNPLKKKYNKKVWIKKVRKKV